MERVHTAWPMIFLLWVTGLLAAAQFAKLTLTLEQLQEVYAGAPVALAVSAVSVIGILCGAIAGFVVAKIGARRSVLIAVILSAAVSLIQGISMPFSVFMASRIAEGFGHLLLVVALPTMMVVLASPTDKPLVMGIWGTFFGVGYALLGLIAPSIVVWGGVQALYIGHGLLLVAFLPILVWKLPRVMAGTGDMPNLIELHRTIYSNPQIFAPGLGHGIYTAIFIATVAFVPPLFGALWLTVALPLANLSGTFVSGFLAQRIPASYLSIACFAIACLCFVLLGFTGSVVIALIALFFTGLTAGANFATVPELNFEPEDQARANGAMAQLGNIGTFSGTPVYAMVAGSLWGIAGISIAICLFGVVFAGLAYHFARKRRDMSAEVC